MTRSQQHLIAPPTVYSDTPSFLGVVVFIAGLAMLLHLVLG